MFMGLAELLILAIGLSMDAFAVSVCKGLSVERVEWKHMAIAGAWFGGFQALMPLIGYLLGSTFAGYIKNIDHWVAFGLLVLIGANMIREAFGKGQEGEVNCSFGFKTMFLMAVATSIDALAIGVTFAFLHVNVPAAVTFIGITTFILSAIGVKVGSLFGAKFESKAEVAGGTILILLGIKILLDHLGIIHF